MQFKNTTYDSSGGIATISDKNHKNSIQTIPESYENLFISLEPVIFKYNSGTSNRYHMGFIAQDLKENLYNNNISIDSFASYVEYGEIDDEGNETFMSSIRYNEFIALNTHMIQICLKRINELEKEIKDLKS